MLCFSDIPDMVYDNQPHFDKWTGLETRWLNAWVRNAHRNATTSALGGLGFDQ